MHKFHPLPPNSTIGGVALALAASTAFFAEPARASGGQVKLNDSKEHGATRNLQRAECPLAAGG